MRASALALVLTFMAIAMRVLIPQGFMAVPLGHGGSVAIALCTGQSGQTHASPAASHHREGASAARTDSDGGQPADPSRSHPCVFSGLYAVAAVEAAGFVGSTAWPRIEPVAPSGELTLAPRTTGARPPPTGPPLQA